MSATSPFSTMLRESTSFSSSRRGKGKREDKKSGIFHGVGGDDHSKKKNIYS